MNPVVAEIVEEAESLSVWFSHDDSDGKKLIDCNFGLIGLKNPLLRASGLQIPMSV